MTGLALVCLAGSIFNTIDDNDWLATGTYYIGTCLFGYLAFAAWSQI